MSMMNMVNPLLVKFSLKSAKYSFSNKYIVCFELLKVHLTLNDEIILLNLKLN